VDLPGGFYGNAASSLGHNESVSLLLERGSQANLQIGLYGNAVQAASCLGHIQIVRLLLEKGAGVDVKGLHGAALQAPSCWGLISNN
jgi:ankyrin repeat protein